MTTHELARLLLSQPAMTPQTYEADIDEWQEVTGVTLVIGKSEMRFYTDHNEELDT